MRRSSWLLIAVALAGCSAWRQLPPIDTEYQAIYLNSGQVMFGIVEKTEGEYVLLREVFYLHGKIDNDTKQLTGSLIKRGQEWHEPQYTYVRASTIQMIEPVSPDSRVGDLIKQARANK